MVFDWDDHAPGNDAMPWMHQLKQLRPDFKATLFAIPALGDHDFWAGHPDWIELAVHGWRHSTVYECADWTPAYTRRVLAHPIIRDHFTTGFKAPGWQISDGCYQALLDLGWWVADQHLEDERRPQGLPTYFYEDGNWHGHVQDWGSNGIRETWPELVEGVLSASSFEFASEAVREHSHA